MFKLFPDYLNVGSTGPAVTFLQQCLAMSSYGAPGLVVDGVYGPMTVESVKALQAALQVDLDGNFGPATRTALKEADGFDFNAVPVPVTCYVSADGMTGFHPPVPVPKDVVPDGTH
ncbi:MAG TPA: hypothetical protein DIS62_05895 [Candidatus Kerfeldbacteria bacterium]|nr:hypothetical protein [Candidatus Kerfeldbacteria bacterium]HCM68493.1 hypothetical protein [Candidatus Kerfeldbacteria bacterium]